MERIVLLTALKMEFDVISSTLDGILTESNSGNLRVVEGTIGSRRIVLACTGLGLSRARQATERIIGEYPVEFVVNPGIAGGLVPGTQPGDVFLCESIHCEEDQSLPVSPELTRRAGQALEKKRIASRLGHLVSVRRVVSDRARKAQLANTLGCDLVDMEAYGIAKVCRDENIPFLPVKTISDLADEDTTLGAEVMDERGHLRPLKVATWVVRHPVDSARILYRLRSNFALALARLQSATREILRELAMPGGQEAEVLFRRTTDRAGFIRSVIKVRRDELQGRKVLLKPNIVSLEGYPTTTHPETLETLITELKKLNCEVLIGDGPAIDARPKNVMRKHVLCDLCRSHGIEPVNFYETKLLKVKGKHSTYAIPALALECDTIISLPTLKTHSLDQLGMSGALKNQFGLLMKGIRLRLHLAYLAFLPGHIQRCIAEINSLVKPDLFIVDAIDVMTNANELRHGGHPAHLGQMLAGTDPVALDAYGFELLKQLGVKKLQGRQPLDIEYMRLATHDYGLGSPHYRAVELNE